MGNVKGLKKQVDQLRATDFYKGSLIIKATCLIEVFIDIVNVNNNHMVD